MLYDASIETIYSTLKAKDAETASNESRNEEDGSKVPRVEIIDVK